MRRCCQCRGAASLVALAAFLAAAEPPSGGGWAPVPWPPRIFVHAPPESGFGECRDRGIHYVLELWVVDLVLNRMREQLFVDDPEKADFILAAQCFSHEFLELLQRCRRRSGDRCFPDGLALLNARIRRWVDALVQGPLHRRRNGSDFVVLTSAEDGRLAFEAFGHPALRRWAFLTPNGPASWLRAHAPEARGALCPWPEYPSLPWDVVVPFPSLLANATPPGPRPRLAFFAGHAESCARRRLLRHFGCDLAGAGVAACERLLPGQYAQQLQQSTFCLVPDGRSSPWNTRLVEAVGAGCIPVVVSDDLHPPFHRTVDWPAAGLFVRTARIPELEALLRAVPPEEVARRQRGLRQLRAVLDPREPGYWQLLLEELRQGAGSRL